MTYRSTKTFTHAVGLSCCFRQWRATHSHCRFLHGYALQVRVEFEAETLDHRNWVVDFGELKDFKKWLEDTFDHKTLLAVDDPHLPTFEIMQQRGLVELRVMPNVGCEATAKYIYDALVQWLNEHGYVPRVRVASVEVSEHEGNSAIYIPAKEKK